MKEMKRVGVVILSVVLLTACGSEEEKRLEQALSFAGNNRPELEKVLAHYADEPEKLEAARFLIRNMPGKYAVTGKAVDEFHLFIDSLYQINREEYDEQSIHKLYQSQSRFRHIPCSRQADLQTLSADFLIGHIDEAFRAWQKPWNRQISFEDFCEWILPYRIGNELPEMWRPLYRQAFAGALTDSVTGLTEACTAVNNELIGQTIHIFNRFDKPSDLKPSSLLPIKFGLCGDYTHWAIYAMRSLGIPAGAGYIPHWGRSNSNHSFNLLYCGNHVYYDFAGGEQNPGDHLVRFEDIPKVYQKSFALQSQSLAMQSKEEIPSFFKNPYLKDITGYFPFIHSQNVTIPLTKGKCTTRYAYLCVFDPKGWFPVDWGEISNRSAAFNHIGPGIIYQVHSFEKGSLQPLSDPFVVDSTGVVTSYACRAEEGDLCLERKYRAPKHLFGIPPAMVGGKFQGSDYADFRTAEDLYTFTEAPDFKYTTVEVAPSKSYRYYRYLSSPNTRGNMAEVEFYETGRPEKIVGEVIGTDTTSIYNPRATKYNVFDGDALTFFHTRDTMSWAGLALPHPVRIDKIRYIIRNDDNGIRKDNLYELFYIDSSGQWASAGRKIAEQDDRLIYEHIPQGTLYWLRNYTRGKEERIFTYENGKQIWW